MTVTRRLILKALQYAKNDRLNGAKPAARIWIKHAVKLRTEIDKYERY